MTKMVLAIFIFNLSAFIQAGSDSSCPKPFKSSDLFCHLRRIAVNQNDKGYDSTSGRSIASAGPSIPFVSNGIINQIAQGPNDLINSKRCAFRRLAESLNEDPEISPEDQEQIDADTRDWQTYQRRNEIRSNDIDGLSEVARIENETQSPGNSSAVNVELKDGNPEVDGFYRYGPAWKKFGTEKTIWQIQEAGKKLAQDGLVMGVGNISKSGGGQLSPHSSHRSGKNVDLRFLNSEGKSEACTLSQSCYDMDKTMAMLETVINVDPSNVKSVIVNDPELRSKMSAKFPHIRFFEHAGHHDHLHLTFEE